MMGVDLFERVVCQPGLRGLYESHYLKAHGPGREAFWIKYCVLSPKDPREPMVIEVWAVLWLKDEQPRVIKRVLTLDGFTLGANGVLFDGQGFHLDPTRASGSLCAEGHSIGWELTLEDESPALLHLPHGWMYTQALPKKKLLTPSPRLRFSGVITVDGRALTLTRWLGLRGHNWGSEHARRYAYGNCNDPTDGSSREIDGFTAKILLGPWESPWLSALVGRGPEGDFQWNHVKHWTTRTEVNFPSWNLWFHEGSRAMELRWKASAEDMVGLRYLHPDGKVSYCYNTRFATLDVRATDRGSLSAWRSERAELEFLFPEPVEGIALHGNSRFIPGEAP